MNQSFIALGALAVATLLTFNMKRSVGKHERSGIEAEIELAASDLSTRTLDRLATLPVDDDPASPSPTPLSLETLHSVDEADGLAQSIDVRMDTSSVTLSLAVEVVPVAKQGIRFQPTTAPTPFRRVVTRVTGPMGADVSFERLYASGDPTL